MAKTDAFQGRLNLRSEPRTKLVAKMLIPQGLCKCLFVGRPWRFAGIMLIPCGYARDQMEIFSSYNLLEIVTILSSPVFIYIRWGVLRCLLGFLALFGQKPCRSNNSNSIESLSCWQNELNWIYFLSFLIWIQISYWPWAISRQLWKPGPGIAKKQTVNNLLDVIVNYLFGIPQVNNCWKLL